MNNKTQNMPVPGVKSMLMTVRIKAENCDSNPDGTWNIDLKARHLTPEETKTINELFPHTQEMVFDLLAKEALLQAID